MVKKWLRILSKLIVIVTFIASIFIVCIAAADPCDPLFDSDGVQLFKPDSSPVCESDTTTVPHSDTCVQVYDSNDEPLLEYAQGNPSFNPAKLHYCPDDFVPEPYTGTLQLFEDLDKNPLQFPVAGLPYNIPTPGYVVPGGGDCGNGFLDPGEECDFGPPETEGEYAFNMETGQLHQDENGQPIIIVGNDDNIPNWCRSNCVLPFFGDGIIDPSYAEKSDGNGNEVSIANDPQWIAFATLFREDPQTYSEQFVDVNAEEENPGPAGPPDPTPDPNGQTLICDFEDHMCKPANEAQNPSTNTCTKNEDCGHFDCVDIKCERKPGPGETKCSVGTETKDCAHLGCEGISCKLVAGKGPNECEEPHDCWGKSCSEREAACVAAPIPASESTCSDDADCDPGPDDDNDSSNDGEGGDPGSSPDGNEYWITAFIQPTGCDPESQCDPGKCPNWCEENLGGACTGTIEDWCTHADNQCNRECVELFVDYEYRATIFPIYALTHKIGEHVGGAIRVPSWTAANRFNREIVCDNLDDIPLDDSIMKKYFNHGRGFYDFWNLYHSESEAEWFLEGPTCIEAGQGGSYRIERWSISGLDAEKGIIPKCILDTVVGSGDCDADWEDRHLTAVTSRACVAALQNADFYCDTLCASDGYGLPYHEIKNDLSSGLMSGLAALLHVPPVWKKDSYGRMSIPLWEYLARSGYIASLRNLDTEKQSDWPAVQAKVLAKWEQYHTKEGDFTCKGAFGEVPENHFSIHSKLSKDWPVKLLSGTQAHNSNTDAAAQLKLAEHCMSIEEAEQGVDEFTSEYDWREVHGEYTVKDICNNICGGNDARLDRRNLARKWAPMNNKRSIDTNQAESKASDGADHWDIDTALSSFASTVAGTICANVSSSLPFCDAKKHVRKDRGQKQVTGM